MRMAKVNLAATDGLLVNLVLIFAVTFICFPGLTDDSYFNFLAKVRNEANWYNLSCLLMFNLLDTIGRFCGGMESFSLGNRTITILTWARFLCVGTFLLIAFEVKPVWLFDADWFKVINLAVFAFGDGHLGTVCSVKAPQTVEGERKGQVGTLISIGVSLGILTGSTLAATAMAQIVKLTPAAQA